MAQFDPKKLLRDKKVIQEINRHKWLESEIAGFDIGYEAAAENWLRKHAAAWVAYHSSALERNLPNQNPAMLKNTQLVPEFVQKAIIDFSNELLRIFDGNVLSIVIYGSAATRHFTPGVSDINLIVLVHEMKFDQISPVTGLLAKFVKNKIAAPLVMTKQQVLDSRDVFPIEFLDIKDKHIVIYGEDFFAHLNVDPKHVRLLCEQQIKGKLIRLTQAFMQSGARLDQTKSNLVESLTSLMPVFRHVLLLNNMVPLEDNVEFLRQLSEKSKTDKQVLIDIYQLKHQKKAMTLDELSGLYLKYLTALAHMADMVNRL